MLGVEGYGSGSENESESEDKFQVALPKQPKLPYKKSSSLVLPPPGPAVKAKRKIAIGLPALKPSDDEDNEKPAQKKTKLTSGAGASSLLSMLPAPKQKTTPSAAPERVLGGGKGPGLVFNSRPPPAESSANERDEVDGPSDEEPEQATPLPKAETSARSTAFLPPSLAKGKSNISLEEGRSRAPARTIVPPAPAVDFFSLGSASSSNIQSQSKTASMNISAAPELPIFEIPEPNVNDRYPGYYQLPSGQWAAHDPEYFDKFRRKWEEGYNAHVRALEKGSARGFEGYAHGDVEDVDASKEMERAKREVKELEERKAITKVAQGEPPKPKMALNASKMSGIARSRHQLATMLNEAYTNREALEEKIAEGRRNRKEAGNKYGF